MKISLCVAVALGAFCLTAVAEESETAVGIALHLMADHSRSCLGIESIPRWDEEIHGSAAMAEARQGWAALGKVMERRTGYVLEDRGSEVLILPKAAPEVHTGPVVERRVTLASSPEKWRTLGEALDAIKFDPQAGEMSLFLVETSKTYLASHAMRLSPGMMASLGVTPERITEQNAVRLADVLFLIARMAGATCWTFQSSEGAIINGQIHYPRKLVDGSISFSGPPDQGEAAVSSKDAD
ncbi:hypothetical protein TSACC_2765 [Terrimicrobium sacchariphilum]|uniref:Uncharacterized protein n=1 Tax=Terrimicrobium sacchariphilum TaxID=690879 RepID=A0A146G5Y8_TERSA|nr:hypothetical protein [Terrimicrobium sacchariphilum]GAT32367.1 hypothetical protein TSACC_2765 [Terrimicrobium sacchariphilum]